MGDGEAESLKQKAREIVDKLNEKFQYSDILFIEKSTFRVNKDQNNTDIHQDGDKGIRLRVFDGETFHQYGKSSWDLEEIEAYANEIIKSIAPKKGLKLKVETEEIEKKFESKPKIDPRKLSVSKKMVEIENAHTKLTNSSKKFVNTRVIYSEFSENKIFVNKYRKLEQNICGCRFIMVPFVKSEEGDIRYYYKSKYSSGFESVKMLLKELPEIKKTALNISKAKKIKPGKYTCVLSPEVTGVLAHESFGHGMESDTIQRGRAKAEKFFGKKIAPTNISIADDPSILDKHGSYFFDDDGKISSITYMINKGVVSDPITEIYSASKIKKNRSANARSESFDHKSYARMSNTFFLPGKSTKAQIFKNVKEGLFLSNPSGGMEDPKGWGVQITGILAEKIKNGKLTGEMFYEVGMTGELQDLLKNVKLISKEFEVDGAGTCGKGHKEWVRVSDGGPYMLVNKVTLS